MRTRMASSSGLSPNLPSHPSGPLTAVDGYFLFILDRITSNKSFRSQSLMGVL